EKQQKPQFKKKLTSIRMKVLEGNIARFRCRVTGYPAPKVNWYLNGQLIRKSKRYRLRYDGIYYLEIVDIKSYDSGEVRVVADNPLGTADGWEEEGLVSSQTAPQSVEAGKPARFSVQVSGVPQPQVFWYKNSQEIKQSEFFRISQFDDSCQLEISRVYPEDEGEYTCMATNNGGTVSCSATLTLDGEFITKKKGCFSYSETIEVSLTEAHSSAVGCQERRHMILKLICPLSLRQSPQSPQGTFTTSRRKEQLWKLRPCTPLFMNHSKKRHGKIILKEWLNQHPHLQ
uniref:Ig-like domain-containing protein n=1 Tax=Maylandia zebra TaxID=106582 RepID=A0A3P9CR64_9CICH